MKANFIAIKKRVEKAVEKELLKEAKAAEEELLKEAKRKTPTVVTSQ